MCHLADRLDASNDRGIDHLARGPVPPWNPQDAANDTDPLIRCRTLQILESQFRKLRFELSYASEEVLVLGLGMVCSIALTGDCVAELRGATAPHLDLLAKLIILGLQSPDALAQEYEYGEIRRGVPVRKVDSGTGEQRCGHFCSLVRAPVGCLLTQPDHYAVIGLFARGLIHEPAPAP